MQKSQELFSKQNAHWFGLGMEELKVWICVFWEAAWQAGLSGIALEGIKVNSKADGHFYVVH